jgi:Phosphotransferase enzyme family
VVVAEQRQFADAESLRPVVRAVFGAGRDVTDVERLAGGSKKGAYRVSVDDGVTVLVYVWNAAEDYWQGVLAEGADDPADPFSHASGLDLFEAASRRLTAAGVRCPRLLLADRSRALYPGDIAVVEHVPGGSLEELLAQDPAAASRPLTVLADWLASMEACRATAFGKVAVVDSGQPSHGTSCETPAAARVTPEVPGCDPLASAAADWMTITTLTTARATAATTAARASAVPDCTGCRRSAANRQTRTADPMTSARTPRPTAKTPRL